MTGIARVFLNRRQGRQAVNVNLPALGITQKSAVAMSAGLAPRGGPFFDPSIRLTVHGPDISITNIAPHGDEGGGGGVEFILNVNADTPTDVAVTIMVFDEFTEFTTF
jgi:hypothetical protein